MITIAILVYIILFKGGVSGLKEDLKGMRLKLYLTLHRLSAALGMEKPPVFYIGGPDTLPPPLERGEEEAALAAMAAGDKRAKQLLIERNLRLVPYSAVGVECALLAAFRPDRITVDGKVTEGILVAVAPNRLSADGEYAAVL